MQQIVYADVLFVINMFITYGMLRLVGIICRSEKRHLLTVLSSFLSGLYSLIIITPGVSDFAIILSRIPVCMLLVFISFRIFNVLHFVRLFSCFFMVNFLFAGIMFALWYLFSPKGMYYNNGIVYFNINIEMLAVLICVCYVFTLLLNKFISFRTPVNTLYEIEIFYENKSVKCRAFYDTGNNLRDAFTSYPVVVADRKTVQPLFECEISLESMKNGVPVFRPVFCSTVASQEMLLSFKADKINVKGVKCCFNTDKAYIAVSDKSFKNRDYSALLGSGIFENRSNEKGDSYLATVIKQISGRHKHF